MVVKLLGRSQIKARLLTIMLSMYMIARTIQQTNVRIIAY